MFLGSQGQLQGNSYHFSIFKIRVGPKSAQPDQKVFTFHRAAEAVGRGKKGTGRVFGNLAIAMPQASSTKWTLSPIHGSS